MDIGISPATLYIWRRQYGGMSIDSVKELTTLKDENARLKRLLADQILRAPALNGIAKGKF